MTQELSERGPFRTVEFAVGEELDGCDPACTALAYVRSTVLSREPTGQEVQAVHRCGMLEIDNRWFLKGVPGASMSGTKRDVVDPMPKPQSIELSRPFRLENKHRVRRRNP